MGPRGTHSLSFLPDLGNLGKKGRKGLVTPWEWQPRAALTPHRASSKPLSSGKVDASRALFFSHKGRMANTDQQRREPESTTISPSLEEQLPQPSKPLSLDWTRDFGQDTGQGPPQETHLGPRTDSAPRGCRSSHPCVHHPPRAGRGAWQQEPEERWEGAAAPRCSSSRLLPGTRGTEDPAQCTMQPLISRLQQEAQGGWEGLPSPQAP